jgi:FkbM family methyltransferase
MALSRSLFGLFPFERGQTRLVNAFGLERYIREGTTVEGPLGLRFRVKPEKRYAYLWYWGASEPKLLRPFRTLLRPGMTVLDVGANFGWYTGLFSRLVGPQGRVHAFEPLPSAFAEAQGTVELNSLAQAEVHNVGVSDKVSSLVFRVDPDRSETASALESAVGATEFRCATTTLDSFVQEQGLAQVDLLKVDVEGLEFEVLQGAAHLLQTHRPILSLEFAGYLLQERGLQSDAILTFLRNCGYAHFLEIRVGQRPRRFLGTAAFSRHTDVLAFSDRQRALCDQLLAMPKSFLRASRRQLRRG